MIQCYYLIRYIFLPQVERDDYKRMMAKYVGHIDVSVKSELGDKAESEMQGAKKAVAAAPTVQKAGKSAALLGKSREWGRLKAKVEPLLASGNSGLPFATLQTLGSPEARPGRR